MSARGSDRWKRLKVALAVAIGGLVLRLLGHTWRVRRVGAEFLDAPLARGEPVVIAFWHGEIAPISWVHRGRGIAPLISTHADGEIIARIVQNLGYRTVRGSTSRGGARAILEMTRLLEQGITVGVTPDGPRGPRHVFSPGAVIVAQRSGRPIVYLRARASRAWRLRSWDRHLVPKPFAKVTIWCSAPHSIEAASARAAEDLVPECQRLLQELGGSPDEPL